MMKQELKFSKRIPTINDVAGAIIMKGDQL